MDGPQIPDIVAFLEIAEKWVGDELDLGELRSGDRLLVHTQNTRYLLVMKGPHRAELTSDRADRPRGSVQIQGCVFRGTKMIKPGHLFCGGALEITLDQGRRTYTTTPIQALQLVKLNPPAATSPSH
jgi:hypothetical protein